MKWLVASAMAVALAAPAAGAEKTFRHYYGMQWEFEPTASSGQIEVAQGELVTQTRLLPTDLFELDSDFEANGKLILAKGTQLAPALSTKAVRCSLGPGKRGSLSADRRVCVMDADGDGRFDAFFDEGLGIGLLQLQFTGCLPITPDRAIVPTMSQVSPDKADWPFTLTITLGKASAPKRKKDGSLEPAWYRFAVVIKRGDKPALKFELCRPNSNGCWVSDREVVRMKGGFSFRPSWNGAGKVTIDVLHPFERLDYYDMSPAGRPDPVYCPGSLFVKTDQRDAW